MKKEYSSRRLATCAMVAALYTVICLAFAPLSFGPIQMRISEAFTLLAVFSPTMAVGVTLGCGVSNLVGFLTGANPLVLDVIFGTLATGIACFFTWKWRHIRIKGYPLLSALPPIVVNAIIIGAEITFLETGSIFAIPNVFLFFAGQVALGQLIPCLILGPLLIQVLERTKVADRYIKER